MKKNGFTLVEIMAVVVLVGLLVSLGSLAIMKSMKNTKIKKAETELAMIALAVEQLAWDTRRWPNGEYIIGGNNYSNSRVMDLSTDKAGLLANDGTYGRWKGPYYEGTLKDPWWNETSHSGSKYFFNYRLRVNGHRYTAVGSFGPDGKFGSSLGSNDDIYLFIRQID